MAMELGLPYNSNKRIESGIKYSLINSSLNGHTCVLKQKLMANVMQILEVEKEYVENCIINLNAKEAIVIEKRREEEWVYLYPFYKAEKNVAEKLIMLMETDNKKYIKNFNNEMKNQQKLLYIKISEKQKEAI